MMDSEDIKSHIAAGLPCEVLHVEGDGRHWFATIVSPAFEGKRDRKSTRLNSVTR